MKKLIVISTLAFSLMSSVGCRTRAVVETRPEPPAVVVRPAQPHPDYVWVEGDWIWTGDRYVYKEGYWAPARPGSVWVAGHWTKKGKGWYWEKGHWR